MPPPTGAVRFVTPTIERSSYGIGRSEAVPFWIVLAFQASPHAAFDLADVRHGTLVVAPSTVERCHSASDGAEIVVCGGRRDRYRLPLPDERGQPEARGDAASGMAALTPATPCGIFAGQRRCTKREAARYGYGEGRDPITMLARLAKQAIDPDNR